MIVAGVSSGAVCLRCQLRLLRQFTQTSQAPNRIFRVERSILRYFSTESTARLGDDPKREDEASDGQKQIQDVKPQGNQRYGAKRVNVRKRRLSHNRILTEDAGSLGSDMLGKPVSVIIMRDGGLYRKKEHPLTPDEEPINQPTDLEALLDNQRKLPTAKEVRHNIDGLRPETETALSEREFRKLQYSLTNGFLSAQLFDYLQHYEQDGLSRGARQESTALADDEGRTPQYDWITEISPWIPLSSPSGVVEGIDPSLYGYVTDSTTVKEKLAIRIMRECWNLSIAELDAGLGETRVKIRDHEFQLLMRGTQRWVTVMGKIWLDPGEKIEAFRKEMTLRFLTTRTKAATLIKDLGETLSQSTTKSFPVNLVVSGPIDEVVLEEVGRITNTHIRKSENSARLHVTWIELKKRASQGLTGLEDLREVVFRLLLTAYNPQPATTTTIYAIGLDNQATGRFITDTASKERLGWKDKMGRWARYTLPLAFKDRSSTADIPLRRLDLPIEPHTTLPEFNEKKEFFPDTQFPAHPVKWAENLRVSTTANFGYLLHADELSASPPSLSDLMAANRPRVFAPFANHPLHFAEFEQEHALVHKKTTVVIRLWPSPAPQTHAIIRSRKGTGTTRKVASEQTSTPLAPLLELRLAVSDNRIKGVESLRAIRQARVTDVMLPASLVDLRFTQAQYAQLEGDPANITTWQPLADFLGPARLDLEHGKLEMPPRQRFPVPKHLFGHPGTRAPKYKYAAQMDSTPPANPNEIISTSYTFAGLEVHRSITMPYRGFKLTYTSIDMERGGRHGAEVSLEPGFASDASDLQGDLDKLHDAFLATCREFATTNSLWSGYQASQQKSQARHRRPEQL